MKRALPRRFRQLGFESLEDRRVLDGSGYTPPGSGFVSIQSVAAGEGAPNTTHWMSFPVTYNGMPVAGGFNVGYETADTTATGFTGNNIGTDYSAKSGSLAFSGAPGETKLIDILVTGDDLVEMTEYFQVNLTSISKPNIGLGAGAGGTIANDDSAVVNMTLDDLTPDESLVEDHLDGDPQDLSNWQYLLRLNAVVDVPVDVWYVIMPMGIEQVDTDAPWTEQHVVLNSTLPAIWGTVVTGDDLVEPDESFQWKITRIQAQGRQVTIGSHTPVNTIENDDLLKIVVDDMEQGETNAGETDFVVTVRALNKVEGGATVTFTTQDYTAGVPENDYVFKQQAFSFTPTGPQSFTMTVKVKGDTAREANEKFMIVASNPQANFGIGLKGGDGFRWGIITIMNDDQGTYTNTGGGRVAFYNSATYLGERFKWCAENEYGAFAYDVASPAAMLAALTAHVAAHGRVDEIAIFEHGSQLGQSIGNTRINGPDTQVWAPLSNDGLHIRFLGCEVGLIVSNGHSSTGWAYCDWVCDDAAPGATVTASSVDTWWYMNPDGTCWYTGAWVNFDGFDKE